MRIALPSVLLVAIVTVSLSACTVLDRIPNPKDMMRRNNIEQTGMLVVTDPADCEIVEGCGPRYTLRSSDFSKRTALFGDIQDDHAQHIVTVRGKRKILSESEQQQMNYHGGPEAINVNSYRVHAKIKYHRFLVEQAQLYTEDTYGCSLLWDKSFAWKLIDDVPYLIVRMTDTFSNKSYKPFVELWYNGKTGDLSRENKSSADLDPCARTS